MPMRGRLNFKVDSEADLHLYYFVSNYNIVPVPKCIS